MLRLLLAAGLFFPLLSWLTFFLAAVRPRRNGKRASGIYIPVIGPVLLDAWLAATGHAAWTLALPWIADIGTLFFLRAAPRLVRDEWRTSRFTREFVLSGAHGNQSVEISFHRGGHYVLTKRWTRAPGEMGIVQLSEPGTYIADAGNTITLTAHTGRTRRLVPQGDGYAVQDAGGGDHYQIGGWTLQRKA